MGRTHQHHRRRRNSDAGCSKELTTSGIDPFASVSPPQNTRCFTWGAKLDGFNGVLKSSGGVGAEDLPEAVKRHGIDSHPGLPVLITRLAAPRSGRCAPPTRPPWPPERCRSSPSPPSSAFRGGHLDRVLPDAVPEPAGPGPLHRAGGEGILHEGAGRPSTSHRRHPGRHGRLPRSGAEAPAVGGPGGAVHESPAVTRRVVGSSPTWGGCLVRNLTGLGSEVGMALRGFPSAQVCGN